MESRSWVIVRKADGVAVLETFEPKVVERVNRLRYDVVPIYEYLTGLNKRLKEGLTTATPSVIL